MNQVFEDITAADLVKANNHPLFRIHALDGGDAMIEDKYRTKEKLLLSVTPA